MSDTITNGDGEPLDWRAAWYALDADNRALAAKLAEVEADRDAVLSDMRRMKDSETDAINRAEAAEAALPAVYRLALGDAGEACTNVIKNYDVMYDGGKKYAPMKTQKAAKGMVSITREDIRALPTPTAKQLMARIKEAGQ